MHCSTYQGGKCQENGLYDPEMLYYCEIVTHKEWNNVRKVILTHEKQFKFFLIFYLTNCHGPP